MTDNTYVRAGQSLGKFDERGPYPRSFEKKQKHSYDMYNTRYTPYTTGVGTYSVTNQIMIRGLLSDARSVYQARQIDCRAAHPAGKHTPQNAAIALFFLIRLLPHGSRRNNEQSSNRLVTFASFVMNLEKVKASILYSINRGR